MIEKLDKLRKWTVPFFISFYLNNNIRKNKNLN